MYYYVYSFNNNVCWTLSYCKINNELFHLIKKIKLTPEEWKLVSKQKKLMKPVGIEAKLIIAKNHNLKI